MMQKRVPLGNYVTEYSVRNKDNEDIPVYSVTNSQGFCREYFGKRSPAKTKPPIKLFLTVTLHIIHPESMLDQWIGNGVRHR